MRRLKVMSIARQLVRGFWNLLRRKYADEDIAEEVNSFFAEAKAGFGARGMTAPGVKIEDLNMGPSVYFTMADESRAFQAVSIWTSGTTSVTGNGEPEQVSAVFASHELLPILGVKPQIGRLFATADDDPKGT